MKDNNAKLKAIAAFGTVLLVVMIAWLLNQFDRSRDIFLNENTAINLYGEMHGYKELYNVEFQELRNDERLL